MSFIEENRNSPDVFGACRGELFLFCFVKGSYFVVCRSDLPAAYREFLSEKADTFFLRIRSIKKYRGAPSAYTQTASVAASDPTNVQ